jgi:CubicO group peptidase (beta-lactamase class C family)
VAVVSDRRILRARGFGEADGSGRAVTPRTPFLLGSTTKTFTSLAVMQLAEAGEVDLDSPVRRYVPEFRLAGDSADQITVRQVLQHTSGLPTNAEGGPILKQAVDGTPLEALAEIEGKEPASPPGEQMEYVNANYVLAGLVVERASGMGYANYIEQEIFDPLGMSDSYAEPEAARDGGLSAGHRYFFGLTDETEATFRPATIAAGYLMSSALDLGKYLAMYLNNGVGLNGNRILSAAGIRALLTPGEPETTLGPWADGVGSRYGLGWFVGGPWQEPSILHPGDAADSSSMLVLLPGRDLGVVTLVNASNELPVPGNAAEIGRTQRNAVDALLGEPVDPGGSVRSLYLWFDLVIALILAASCFALFRAVDALRNSRLPHRRRLSIAAIPLRFLLAALFAYYPLLIGYGWRPTFAWHPDLAIALILVATVLLAVAATRTAWLVNTGRSEDHRGEGYQSDGRQSEGRRTAV